MSDRRLSPRYFDNARELVSTKFQTVNGASTSPGDTLPADLPHGMRMRLWMSRRAVYADLYAPTPVQEEGDQWDDWAALYDGWAAFPLPEAGWVLVPESGLDENGEPMPDALADAEQADTQEIAVARLTALRAAASLLTVRVAAGAGGWYAVEAAWLAAPVRIKGKAAAEARRAEIDAEGPPEGWVHPDLVPVPTEATEIREGAVVTQSAEGAALFGIRATVRAVEDGQATVVWFDGPTEDATLHELVIAVEDLSVAPEAEAPAEPAG